MSGKSKSNRNATQAASKRKVVPEDLLRMQLVSDPQISPSGEWILYSKKHVGEKHASVTNLWLVATEGGASRQFTAGGKDGHGRWSPDGQQVAFVRTSTSGVPQIWTISGNGGEAIALTKFPEGTIRDFRWAPDGKSLAVAFRETAAEWTSAAKKSREESGLSTPPRVLDEMYYRLDGDGYFNHKRFGLYLVDIDSGESRLVFDKDTLGDFSYDWSPDSQQLVVSANTSKNALLKPWKAELFLLDAVSGKTKKIPDVPVGTKEAVRWSPDGQWIAFVGREGKQSIWGVANDHLFVCDPQKGDPVNLTAGEDYCMAVATLSDTQEAKFGANYTFSADSQRILMTLGWHGETHLASIGVTGGKIEFHTQGPRALGLGNLSADGNLVALTDSNQLSPAEIALGEWGAWKKGKGDGIFVRKLSDWNDAFLDELQLAPAESHWVEADDGHPVQFWVMKPPGFKEGKKYPAVLEIHGGPHTQYGEVFFHEFQVLAAAGYVVVYSNPRGSKGYGEEHCMAIKGRWGDADWRDIQAVTSFMQAQPDINSARMGVMGGSYGGYMTNWVISHCQDFAGAITDRCVFNLVSMAGTSDLPLVPGHYWEGNSWDQPEQLWEQSPLKHFGQVKTPTLVIHSEGDLRCNVEQGEQVYVTLKMLGVPTRFVRYPSSTSHGMSRGGPPDLRIHRLGEILGWWDKYLC